MSLWIDFAENRNARPLFATFRPAAGAGNRPGEFLRAFAPSTGQTLHWAAREEPLCGSNSFPDFGKAGAGRRKAESAA